MVAQIEQAGDHGEPPVAQMENESLKQATNPERFDAMVAKPEKLWGAPAIAQALGVSVATVYRLAGDGCPIYRPGGRYFAYRSELENWLRTAA